MRLDEHRILRAALARAGSGGTGAVVCIGEPGIGKSRVVQDFAVDAAVTMHVFVLQLEPTPPGSVSPYAPLLDLVNDHWDDIESADAGEQGARLAAAVRDGAPQRVVLRLFDELVEALAAEDRVLLVADHSGAVTAPVLTALAHVVRRSGDRSVLVLVTARENEVGVERFVDDTDALVLPLVPLDDDEVTEVLAQDFGDLPQAVRDEIVRRAEGNPLHAAELAEAHRQAGEGAPATLRLLVLARLERLGDRSLQFVRAAAATGRPVTARFCAFAAGLDPDDPSLVDDAVDAGVLVRRADGTLTFPNPLVAEFTLAATPVETLRELHLRLTELLLVLESPRAEIAHHAIAAATPGDGFAREAVSLACEAAEVSLATGATDTALDLVRRARQLLPEVPAEARLTRIEGDALLHTGEIAAAARAFERSLALHADDTARLGLARALQRSGRLDAALGLFEACSGVDAERGRAEVLLGLGRVDDAWRVARAEVVRAEEGGDDARLASALANAALVEAVSMRPGAVDTATRAVEIWERAGEDSLDWPPLYALGLALESADHFDRSLAVLRRLRVWCDVRGQLEWIPRIARSETIAAFLSCNFAQMHDAIAAASDTKRNRPSHELASIWAGAAALAAVRGDDEQWRRASERSASALAEQSTPFDAGLQQWWLGIADAMRGDYPAAVDRMLRAADVFRSVGAVDFLLRTLPTACGLTAVTGDTERTRELADEYHRLGERASRLSARADQLAVDAALPGDVHERARILAEAAALYRGSDHRFGMLHTVFGAALLDPDVLDAELVRTCADLADAIGMDTPLRRLARLRRDGI